MLEEKNSADPASLGYRMPPEWAPHKATWISWPHNRESWPGKFEAVEPAMLKIVAELVRSEPVYINVCSSEHAEHVRALLQSAKINIDQVELLEVPTNDAWCRDHGAIFVTRQGKQPILAIDCEYNAWGGKYPPWDLDAQAAAKMAEWLGVPKFDAGLVLEGGSIDVNGSGALITTEQCLLNPNRNPHLDRTAIEDRLRALFGVNQIIWLGDGIVGDDTDGHVDDLTRFVARDTVVSVVETDQNDENYPALADNLARLKSITLIDGTPLKIVELPMPAPLYHEGQRLPASYANFYVANRVVLMPAFNDANDEIARAQLASCFSDREVVAVDCRDLVWGLGAIHCLTQQLPATDGLATALD